MDKIDLATISQLLGIVSIVFGALSFLFNRIVINPLKHSIEELSSALREFEKSTETEMHTLNKEIYELSLKAARLDEITSSMSKRIDEVCKIDCCYRKKAE